MHARAEQGGEGLSEADVQEASVRLDHVRRESFDPTAGKKYFFVLDESGTEKKPAEDANKEKTDELKVQRPRTPDLKYDRLYFDRNGDLDLTNDGVLKLAEKSPFEGVPRSRWGSFRGLGSYP